MTERVTVASFPDRLDDRLDNPIWHSLTGPLASFALADPIGRATCFEPEVSVFAAPTDPSSGASWAGIAEVLPGATVGVFGDGIVVPDGWNVLARFRIAQLVAPKGLGRPGNGVDVLGPSDLEEVLDLVERTKPGPFRPRGVELGTYVGIRREGKLAAMAGQRLRVDGAVEISAVCTDPDFRNQGLSGMLVRDLIHRIEAGGDVAFLHSDLDNDAVDRYRAMGFVDRTTFDGVSVQVPG